MKLSLLDALLKGKISSAEFKSTIAEEIRLYEAGTAKTGNSVPIQVNEDAEMVVTPQSVGVLCLLHVSDVLSISDLSYIADALLLSEKVMLSSEEFCGFISEMTDPEINGLFSKDRAFELIGHVV